MRYGPACRYLLAAGFGLALLVPDASASRQVVPFNGGLDVRSGRLVLAVGPEGQGASRIEVTHPVPARYELTADIRHVTVGSLDVAAQLQGRFELTGVNDENRGLSGHVASRYTLLNYKPVRDLDVKFSLRDRSLEIERLQLGVVNARGRVGLVGDRDLDLAVDVSAFEAEDLWNLMEARGLRVPSLTGSLRGGGTFKGAWRSPRIEGQLSVVDGCLSERDSGDAQLHVEGVYPRLVIREGVVTPRDGPVFRVSGPLDLSDLTRLPQVLDRLKREPIVSQERNGTALELRRTDPAGDHVTQLKAFIRDGTDGRGKGDSVLGVQKQIGF